MCCAHYPSRWYLFALFLLVLLCLFDFLLAALVALGLVLDENLYLLLDALAWLQSLARDALHPNVSEASVTVESAVCRIHLNIGSACVSVGVRV